MSTSSRLPPDGFGSLIAETPYDAMGQEFQDIFGRWIDDAVVRVPGTSRPRQFQLMVFDLFSRRLALACRYRTFFSTQVIAGDRALWRERFTGVTQGHAYSFAIRGLPRTERFYAWCEQQPEPPNTSRTWDHALKPFPELPLGPHEVWPVMPVWARLHQPKFRARREGPYYLRRLRVNESVHLIEHSDHRWVPNIRQEAAEHWFRANEQDRSLAERAMHLAQFEWLWFWLNPFGRAGALTGDAMSLLAQKQMVLDGLPVHLRPGYYHQDCEAFLLSEETYITKRVCDLLAGFTPRFDMELLRDIKSPHPC